MSKLAASTGKAMPMLCCRRLLDAADLDDAGADAVCEILLPKLWQRSGLDVFALRAVISPMLPFRPSGPLQ
jgi:hypothetical protein